MYHNETLELFEIIKAFDFDILKITPNYEVQYNGRSFYYNTSYSNPEERLKYHEFRLQWITEKEDLTQTPTVTVGSVTSVLHSYNTSNIEYINTCIVRTNTDLTKLVSVEWKMGLNNNLIYPQAMISSTIIRKNSSDIKTMCALYLSDNKVLINGILYDPDSNAKAFTDDISSDDKIYSVLNVINLRNEYNGV